MMMPERYLAGLSVFTHRWMLEWENLPKNAAKCFKSRTRIRHSTCASSGARLTRMERCGAFVGTARGSPPLISGGHRRCNHEAVHCNDFDIRNADGVQRLLEAGSPKPGQRESGGGAG